MRLPLLDIDSPDAVVAHYGDEPVPASRFIAQAEAVARSLDDVACIINLAENRYHFLLGWVAASLREKITLLPHGHTEDILSRLRGAHPDHQVLDDDFFAGFPDASPAGSRVLPEHWQVPADRVVAVAFTSGSTGEPQAHAKTWRGLVENTRLVADELLGGRHRSLVSTVAAQHMFGLEASLLGALLTQCRLCDRKPFFPADVRRALQDMPAPRVLVTTPAHLKVMAQSGLDLPALDCIVSATAPLSAALALDAEQRWATRVVEIYGCTEAGVMAHRRTTQGECWRTFGAGHMRADERGAWYHAPQHDAPIPLQDLLELRSPTEFELRGRAADMIKVAGKRTSLQELTAQLLAVRGVEDGVVFMPEGAERPAAAVVAPGMTSAAVLAELRAHLDGVLVPRPLLLVDRLPRNELGKLPHEALLHLLESARP